MKKLLTILLSFTMMFSLVACSSMDSGKESTTSNDSVSVDENLLTVDITLPADFFEDETKEEIEAGAKEAGYLNCVVHEDGSVTYTMTKAKRAEVLKEYKAQIDETITELTGDGEGSADSFKSITYDKNVTQFDVRVDRAAYESSWTDSFYMLSLYMLGGYYQLFNGVPNDDIDVVVNIIDDSTGEQIESGSYQNYISQE